MILNDQSIDHSFLICHLSLSITAQDAPWRSCDDRFFFNKHLLQELIELGDSRADPFIMPIVQGYVEVMHAPLDLQVGFSFLKEPEFDICGC